MSLEFRTEENKLVCIFPNRLDTETCPGLESVLNAKLDEWSEAVVFDLSHVEYMSSAFLRLSLNVFKKLGGDRFSIINVSPTVKKVFKISGFDRYITIL